MARKPRIEYRGAVYHVMNRGDKGGKIFKDDLDRELFLSGMGEVCKRTGWIVHSYVLIPNHFHWLLETPDANLVAGMKWFLGAYSQRFNNRHAQRGHVFQGRYKAVVVESDSGNYFETVSTYVHLNPARARLLSAADAGLEQYKWSSYPLYLQSAGKRPWWLEVRRVLGNLGLRDDVRGRHAYEMFMQGRIDELRTRRGKQAFKEQWKALRYGWYAGSEEFRTNLLGKLSDVVEENQRDSYSGPAMGSHAEAEAEKLIEKGMKVLGVHEEDLDDLPKGHEFKCLLAWLAHTHTTVRHSWLAARLQMGYPTTMSTYIRRVRMAQGDETATLRNRLTRTAL